MYIYSRKMLYIDIKSFLTPAGRCAKGGKKKCWVSWWEWELICRCALSFQACMKTSHSFLVTPGLRLSDSTPAQYTCRGEVTNTCQAVSQSLFQTFTVWQKLRTRCKILNPFCLLAAQDSESRFKRKKKSIAGQQIGMRSRDCHQMTCADDLCTLLGFLLGPFLLLCSILQCLFNQCSKMRSASWAALLISMTRGLLFSPNSPLGTGNEDAHPFLI